jgi:polar amino acid transport system substrate-binding protein
MKKMERITGVLIFACLVLTVLGACAKKGNDLAAIKERGEIVLFTDARWAPYEYIGVGGKEEGVDIDLAKAIADDIGVKLRIINADFDGFSLAIQNGQADFALAAITITEERAETLDFSIPYANSTQYILKVEDNTAIQTLNDLAGLKIGVHLGTTGDFLVSEQINEGVLIGTGAEVVQFKSLQEAVLALKKGDLGAVVCDESLAKNLATVNAGTNFVEAKFADGSINLEEYGAAVKKGNKSLLDAINTTLQQQIASGAIDQSLAFHSENSAVN